MKIDQEETDSTLEKTTGAVLSLDIDRIAEIETPQAIDTETFPKTTEIIPEIETPLEIDI